MLTLASPLSANQQTIVILGDSISAGYGIAADKGWVELLRQELNENMLIINASISGETSAGGLARTDAILERHNPDIFVLELGGNDGLRGYPLDTLKDNLSLIIEKASSSGSQVILLGMRIPPNYGRRYSEGFYNIYQELADKYSIRLVPFFLEGIGGNNQLIQADGIHPNTNAQPILLNNAKPIIEEALRRE